MKQEKGFYQATENEEEQCSVYAGLRLDGYTKDTALAALFSMGYTPTSYVLRMIRTKDKYIWFGS